jgi:hypothetical protein
VYAFVEDAIGIVKVGFTRCDAKGVRKRLTTVRRERRLPGLILAATIGIGDYLEVEGWSIEEAIRLWLVRRCGFEWHPWQDFLVMPSGVTSAHMDRLLGEALESLNAWLAGEPSGSNVSLGPTVGGGRPR